MVANKLEISVCTFRNGDFTVYIRDGSTGEEVQLEGHQPLTEEEFDVVNKLAPACVYSTYIEDLEG